VRSRGLITREHNTHCGDGYARSATKLANGCDGHINAKSLRAWADTSWGTQELIRTTLHTKSRSPSGAL